MCTKWMSAQVQKFGGREKSLPRLAIDEETEQNVVLTTKQIMMSYPEVTKKMSES